MEVKRMLRLHCRYGELHARINLYLFENIVDYTHLCICVFGTAPAFKYFPNRSSQIRERRLSGKPDLLEVN
jgi:hypothetical protein